jgi:hypothetical protein
MRRRTNENGRSVGAGTASVAVVTAALLAGLMLPGCYRHVVGTEGLTADYETDQIYEPNREPDFFDPPTESKFGEKKK